MSLEALLSPATTVARARISFPRLSKVRSKLSAVCGLNHPRHQTVFTNCEFSIFGSFVINTRFRKLAVEAISLS
jgi:hypothetical protein